MTNRPTTRYAKQGDLRIAYQVVGDGPLDLIFAPGLPLPIDLIWDEPRLERFLRRLASFSRLVMFDYRSSGASRLGPGQPAPTLELWADDVRIVMDTVGIERAALIGWFVGAFPLIYLAASQPERVSHLGVINGFARLLRDEGYEAGMSPQAFEAGADAYLASYGTGPDLSYFAPSLAGDESFRQWWARCERLGHGPTIVADQWRDYARRDVRSALPAVGVPTLILHRSGNRFVRVGHGRFLAEHIPDARCVELDGEDHLFFTQDGDVVLDAIESFLTGTSAGIEPDRVLAAVLFTDVVGSTIRAVEMGDRRWRELLDRHDAFVTAAAEKFRGRVVQTTGDGVLATFDGPARAISCARALREEARALDLQLRQRIHMGEVERRGTNIGGIAVHLAARVQTAAEPDSVLVSRTVADLVTGSGIEFEDRGEHELKGIPGRWQLLEVVA